MHVTVKDALDTKKTIVQCLPVPHLKKSSSFLIETCMLHALIGL